MVWRVSPLLFGPSLHPAQFPVLIGFIASDSSHITLVKDANCFACVVRLARMDGHENLAVFKLSHFFDFELSVTIYLV